MQGGFQNSIRYISCRHKKGTLIPVKIKLGEKSAHPQYEDSYEEATPYYDTVHKCIIWAFKSDDEVDPEHVGTGSVDQTVVDKEQAILDKFRADLGQYTKCTLHEWSGRTDLLCCCSCFAKLVPVPEWDPKNEINWDVDSEEEIERKTDLVEQRDNWRIVRKFNPVTNQEEEYYEVESECDCNELFSPTKCNVEYPRLLDRGGDEDFALVCVCGNPKNHFILGPYYFERQRGGCSTVSVDGKHFFILAHC